MAKTRSQTRREKVERGHPGGPGRIQIRNPGSLKAVGYTPHKSAGPRHIALRRAVERYGKGKTIQKLNAIHVLTKHTAPAMSRTYAADIQTVRHM